MIELTTAMLVIETRKSDGTKKYHIGATRTFRIVDSFEREDGEVTTAISWLHVGWLSFETRFTLLAQHAQYRCHPASAFA